MLKATLATPQGMWLAIFAVVMAGVSVYYYFRLVQAMYFKEGEPEAIVTTAGFRYTLLFIAVLIILLGIFPNLLLAFFYF